MTELLEREVAVASAAAIDAGRRILEVYATDFAVSLKGENDPVTRADELANDAIVDTLEAHFPGDAIVAEEGSGPNHDAPRRIWFVDPLDGTKEFISKNGEFSVMIGLAIEGRAALGVVYQPTTDRLFVGVVGAYAERLDGARDALVGEGSVTLDASRLRRTPLRVSDTAAPSALRLVVSRSHRSAATDALRDALGITGERPSGSVGLKVGLLATREADLYVHLSDKSHAWDACAPEAILVAAGGRFTGLDGMPLRYDLGPTKNARGILACNAAAFDSVLPAVRTAARAAGMLG